MPKNNNLVKLIPSLLKQYLPLILLIIIFGFLFLFKLGTSYLDNWDEAWYASITREMIRSKDFIHLMWNGTPFIDHPPAAMWLMALSYAIFGINEFSTRLPSATLGIFSIILLYFLSYELFKKKSIAFVSSLILGSCIWYVTRVRSGNLDAALVFFYILTGYLSIKSSKNIKLLPFTFLSYAILMLTKTLVGLPMGLLILFWNFHTIKKFRWWILSISIFIFTVSIWYIPNIYSNQNFIFRHFFQIGLREKVVGSFFHLYIQQNLYYLHNGIAKWYYPFILAVLISIILIILNKKRKELTFLLLWLLLVSYPFFTSDQTQIWHLIPIYIPIALLIPFIIHQSSSFIKVKYISAISTLSVGILFCLLNFKTYYRNIFPTYYVPDEVAISKEASKYNYPLYLNAEFVPRTVFYSGKNVSIYAFKPNSVQDMINNIKSNNVHPIIITNSSNELTIKQSGIKIKELSKKGDIVLLKVE